MQAMKWTRARTWRRKLILPSAANFGSEAALEPTGDSLIAAEAAPGATTRSPVGTNSSIAMEAPAYADFGALGAEKTEGVVGLTDGANCGGTGAGLRRGGGGAPVDFFQAVVRPQDWQ